MKNKIEVAFGILNYILIQIPETHIAQAITDTSTWDALARQSVAMIVALGVSISSRFMYDYITLHFKKKNKKIDKTGNE